MRCWIPGCAQSSPSARPASRLCFREVWTRDKDLPQPSVRQPARPPRERPRTPILSSPGSSGGLAPAARAPRPRGVTLPEGAPQVWFWGSPRAGGSPSTGTRAGGAGTHGKNTNEADQKNPKLMSRLEIRSQNLFWLGVAAPTCQTSGEAGSSGGGGCCPEGPSEMKRVFVNTCPSPGPEKGWLGPGPSSSPARPDSRRSSPPACTRRTMPETLLPGLTLFCTPEKHRGSTRESKI